MGYYTRYELEYECDDDTPFDLKTALEEHTQALYYALDEDGNTCDSVKWYDYDKDMCNLAKAYPTVTFTLHGDGEEEWDEWIAYYKGDLTELHKKPEWEPPHPTWEGEE